MTHTSADDDRWMLPAGVLARHFGVAVGTIYRWASQDRWSRHGTRGARLYDLRDAQASHDRRHRAEIDVVAV